MAEQSAGKVPQIRFKGFEEEWEDAKVSDFVLSLDAGVSVNSGERTANSTEFGILKTSAVTNGVFKAAENKVVLTESEQSRLKESVSGGTIIISRMNTPALVGANAYVESSHENLFLPDRLWAAKPREGTSMRFLAAILGSDKGRDTLSKLAKGTSGSMKNITKPDVLAVSVMAPSPSEQTQVGEYFRELDSLIGLHQRKHDKLVTLKKTMLQKMFPQPGTTTPEIRFKGFLGDWKAEKLGKLGTFSKGYGYSKSDLSASGTPIVLYGRLYVNYQNEISEVDTFAAEKKGMVKSLGKEVIVPASGETAEDIARASAILTEGIILGGDLNIIYPSKDLNSSFLALTLSNGKPQRDLAKRAQGKTVVHVRQPDLESIGISFPELTEQQKIASYFRTLDSLIAQHATQLQKLQQIKSACLARMFV